MSREKYPTDEKSLGGRLRIYRETNGIKLTDFTQLVNISQGSLSDIENNKAKPSSKAIENLIRHSDISIYWLYTGLGDMVRTDAELKGKPGPRPINPTIAALLESARTVLESGNPVAFDALERNIRYFEHAIKAEERTASLEEKCDTLIKKVEDLESKIEAKDTKEEEGVVDGEWVAAAGPS